MSKIEWDGKGFPPVGCECQRLGYVVTILAHAKNHGRTSIIFQRGHAWSHSDYETEFRPIRPERERAIDEMRKALDSSYSWGDVFAALYDAGYRKVKE